MGFGCREHHRRRTATPIGAQARAPGTDGGAGGLSGLRSVLPRDRRAQLTTSGPRRHPTLGQTRSVKTAEGTVIAVHGAMVRVQIGERTVVMTSRRRLRWYGEAPQSPRLVVGDRVIELHHARGETDDHLWGWMPEERWAFVGDFVIWNFPNAGNPQKVQRFPIEWAAALRAMAAIKRAAGTYRTRLQDMMLSADDTLLVQGGYYGLYVGRLDLTIDSETDTITDYAYTLMPVNLKKQAKNSAG